MEVQAIPMTVHSSNNIILGNSIYDIDSVILTQYGATLPFDMGIDLFLAIDSLMPPNFLPDSFVEASPTLNDTDDVDSGANYYLNFPTLTSTVQTATNFDIELNLTSAGSPTNQYRVEFFASDTATTSGYDSGQLFLGFVNTALAVGLSTTLTLSDGLNLNGKTISITATPIDSSHSNGFGGTSEFGNQIVALLGIKVSNETVTTTAPASTTATTLIVNKNNSTVSGKLSATGSNSSSDFFVGLLITAMGCMFILLTKSKKIIHK